VNFPRTLLAYQAHRLDPDFYKRFYKEGVVEQNSEVRIRNSGVPSAKRYILRRLDAILTAQQRPAVLCACALIASCRPQSHVTPLLQRGYLWQRDWTQAVAVAVTEADRQMDGVVVHGADIQWNAGRPSPIRANLSWQTLEGLKKPVALALRIEPYPGPLAAMTIVREATRLIQDAKAHRLNLSELQLDFDCPQKKLAGYEIWVRTVRTAIHGESAPSRGYRGHSRRGVQPHRRG
jgi:hypothetical protein